MAKAKWEQIADLIYKYFGLNEDFGRDEVEGIAEAHGLSTGKIRSTIKDEDMASLRRREVAFVYQYDNLVPHLTAYENITLPLLLDKKKETEFKERIVALCNDLGIGDRLNNLPSEMSGGEQQRVAIARALAIEPKVIFLDEPTGSLDSERGRQVMEILKDINEKHGVALIMVTHSPAHAEYASRKIIIEDGQIK